MQSKVDGVEAASTPLFAGSASALHVRRVAALLAWRDEGGEYGELLDDETRIDAHASVLDQADYELKLLDGPWPSYYEELARRILRVAGVGA